MLAGLQGGFLREEDFWEGEDFLGGRKTSQGKRS